MVEAIFDYLLIIAAVLVVAKILGELCERIGVPSILGELGTGIILGPSLIGLIFDPAAPIFAFFAEVGIIMLLFVAGFEHVDIKGMLKYKKASVALSIVRSLIALASMTVFGLSMGYPMQTSLMLGVALSASSMGITVRSLLDCNQINSKPGRTLLGSLVINDITSLIMITILIVIVTSTSGNLLFDIIFVLGGIVAFFVFFVVAEYLGPYILLYAVRLRVEEAQFTIVFVLILAAAFIAHNLGLSTMIGAFFAGIALSRSSILETETFSQKISSVSYGLFIPMFFVMAGAVIDLSNIAESFGLAVIILIVITPLHLGGALTIGRVFKYGKWNSILMGIGMYPYGEVTLVVMTALMSLSKANPGAFGDPASLHRLFSAVLILIALTVIMAPIAMKFISKRVRTEERTPKSP